LEAKFEEHVRDRLLRSRKALEEQLQSLNLGGLAESLQDSIQELSSYDNHPGDLGSEVFERSKDLALRDNVKLQLQKIEDALANLEKGQYGICRRCGQEISRARLEALPETTLCLDCQQGYEREDRKRVRPIEEEVLRLPFGRPAGIGQGMQYDGEDAWQDVARWNEHAERSQAGSYYGGSDLNEDRGYIEGIEALPYFKGADGVFYEDTGAYLDDEGAPEEPLEGDEGWDVTGPQQG
jgi:YteA family regulatory protein